MTSVRRHFAVPPAVGLPLVLALGLALVPASPRDVCGQSKVEGEVLSGATGLPLAGALVLLPQLELVGVSDDFGYFAFERVPTGVHQVVAYLAGYTALVAEAPTGEGEVLELHMSPSPIPLPGIGVEVASEEEQTARLLGRAADLTSCGPKRRPACRFDSRADEVESPSAFSRPDAVRRCKSCAIRGSGAGPFSSPWTA